MKYNITFSCGHTGTVELFGKDKDRHKKLEYFQENGLCSECYKKMMREEEQAQPITCNIIIFSHTETPFTLYLTGNVFPVKDTIKQLGYKWSFPDSDGYGSVSNYTYKCWTKKASMMELEDEVISNIAKPQKPACYPEGYWNGKFYKSSKAGHRRIYVDNKEVIISEEDCVLLDKYLQEKSEYFQKVAEIKKRAKT